MHIILLTSTAFANFAIAISSAAAADTNANYYANTITLSDAKFGERSLLINADKTYAIHTADGKAISGSWEDMGDQTCFTQLNPVPAPEASKQYCTVNVVHQVGETWQMVGPAGENETLSLKAGR